MRSTKIAPVALSTSYLTGSASFGISMMTLISYGPSRPVGTRSRPMGKTPGFNAARGAGGEGAWCARDKPPMIRPRFGAMHQIRAGRGSGVKAVDLDQQLAPADFGVQHQARYARIEQA